jgi:hypothetical protein
MQRKSVESESDGCDVKKYNRCKTAFFLSTYVKYEAKAAGFGGTRQSAFGAFTRFATKHLRRRSKSSKEALSER